MSKRVEVRIINPISCNKYTALANAERYVADGRAEWVWERNGEMALAFISADHRHKSANASAAATRAAIRRGYTDGGMATLEQVRGIPVIQPVKLLTGKPRPLAMAS